MVGGDLASADLALNGKMDESAGPRRHIFSEGQAQAELQVTRASTGSQWK